MTPYDPIFERADFEQDLFPALRDDADERGLDTTDVNSFLQLAAFGDVLQLLSPRESMDAPPVTGVTALAYHGFHFWLHGKRNDVLDEAATRTLLDSAHGPIGDWPMRPPVPSGYVSLAHHILWAMPDAGAAEPVHGFFYVHGPSHIDLLLALGVRRDRPGFTAMEVAMPCPTPAPGHFGDIPAREGGNDFANVLPGGEHRSLHAVTNTGEVFKLASRVFHQLV